MSHFRLFIRTLQKMGFTDDTGNPIPTCDKRYSLDPRENFQNCVTLGEGLGDTGCCRFFFDNEGNFVNHGVME